ncbi:MAG: hypothetical protein AAF572_29150 [Cyanobacteria bacterium P01_B01_bin.77]
MQQVQGNAPEVQGQATWGTGVGRAFAGVWAALLASVRWLGPQATGTILAVCTMAMTWATGVHPASADVELVTPYLQRALACGAVIWLTYAAVQLLPTRRLLAGAARLFSATCTVTVVLGVSFLVLFMSQVICRCQVWLHFGNALVWVYLHPNFSVTGVWLPAPLETYGHSG